MKTNLILFRNDLRIHDNEALFEASKADRLIPVYVFDPRKFTTTEYGFPRVGPHRIRFLMETVLNLRKNLRLRHSDLVIRTGKPEEIVPALAREFGAGDVFLHAEATSEEREDEDAIERALASMSPFAPANPLAPPNPNTSSNPPGSEIPAGIHLRKFWGSTLYHLDDLPMETHQVAEVFSDFRKRLEKGSRIREVLAMPDELPPCPVDYPGELPEPKALRAVPDHFLWDDKLFDLSHKSVLDFKGGEDVALQRIQSYIWDGDHLKRYKETRNGLLGADYSSKFSPWLATGTLSPRYIHDQVRQYEKERVKNNSTYWMIFELIWRDYFRFVFMKHGNALFKTRGIRKTPHPVEWQRDHHIIRVWQRGETGIPFVDANMRELLQTGFMSNRGRQNAASFFSWNLRQEWRIGAAWFEALLLDYDPCSNWGNWAYNSGVGNDPRQRYFNILGQADRYDKNGDYVRHWIPELSNLPASNIHKPHLLSVKEQRTCGTTIGEDYPVPVIDLDASYEMLNS
ncbi:MAG: DASH family cryptochrome [Balneolaceae bacterium]|nr:MAG: DASH family cryptochrome [Balneolaceae bacterium]